MSVVIHARAFASRDRAAAIGAGRRAQIKGGYYLVPRVRRHHPLWLAMSVEQRAVMDECIERAAWKGDDGIPRGSFQASERDLATAAKVSRKQVRRALSILEADGFLTRVTDGGPKSGPKSGPKKGRPAPLIKIRNYDYFQNPANYETSKRAQNRAQNRAQKGLDTTLLEERSKRRGEGALFDSPLMSQEGSEPNTSTQLDPGLHPPNSAPPPGPRDGAEALTRGQIDELMRLGGEGKI